MPKIWTPSLLGLCPILLNALQHTKEFSELKIPWAYLRYYVMCTGLLAIVLTIYTVAQIIFWIYSDNHPKTRFTIREKKSWHTSVLLQYYSRFQKFAVEIHQWTSKQHIRHSLLTLSSPYPTNLCWDPLPGRRRHGPGSTLIWGERRQSKCSNLFFTDCGISCIIPSINCCDLFFQIVIHE